MAKDKRYQTIEKGCFAIRNYPNCCQLATVRQEADRNLPMEFYRVSSLAFEEYKRQTPQRLKIIDAYMLCTFLTGVLQFLYCAIVGTFPFNSFLAGFISCVASFVLAASLRIQMNPQNKSQFPGISRERAFADFLMAHVVLHLFVINFIGYCHESKSYRTLSPRHRRLVDSGCQDSMFVHWAEVCCNSLVMDLLKKLALLFVQCVIGYLASFIEYFAQKPKSVVHKVIAITGAAQGIGREVAFMFASMKAKVVLLDLNQELAEQTAKLINSTGGQAYAFGCDVADPAQMRDIAKQIRNDPSLGCPDVILCAAGVWTVKLLEDTTDSDVQKTINVNTLGCFWTIRAFYPYMLERGSGHIVVVSSMADDCFILTPRYYSASKFAVRGLTESLEWEIFDRGQSDHLKVTTIYPFLTETNLLNSCQISTDVFRILPIAETAQSIVNAILYEKTEVFIPSYSRFLCVWIKCLIEPSRYVRIAVRNFLNIRYK
ncbi:hypothetical protein M514_03205 [Trichuris suis]|uniref:Uncharacterized protein n=1 Tax=Trichuris suis TaxID=68888 RepID=A0A085N982_9BILA|nr:hypothetical protein M514_03205 [Trichuris suis]